MIKKLQMKFIVLTMSALFAVLFIIITGMNIVNYRSVVSEADDILAVLAQNEGTFPEFKKDPPASENADDNDFDKIPFKDLEPDEEREPDSLPGNEPKELPKDMSIETPYESRYFSVLLKKESKDVIQVETGRIASVDSEDAIEYAKEVLESEKEKGFMDNFRYICQEEAENIRITFLDCGSRLDSVQNFLLISIAISCFGFIIVTLIIMFFSNRIIRPISESYEKQKRFITDAGHEIKTPLTIINADADILEMDVGENEWIDDIHKQTKRLTELTNNLVLLTRMEESESTVPKIEFPISDVVTEAALSFQALAQTQHKHLVLNIQPMLSIRGDSKGIHQLVTLLLDNAVKYSPKQTEISLSLEQKNKSIQIIVTNISATPLSRENLNLLFDRFYRADSSRNFSTGGYGIGLSVAKAIVMSHSGKIRAVSEDGETLQIQISLPM